MILLLNKVFSQIIISTKTNGLTTFKMLTGKPFKNKIDLLVGGSPCQSFSLVGKRRGFKDSRGTLFYEFARLIK